MSQSSSGSSRPLDLYFISVRGGFRPLNQQTHLLKQVYFSSSLLIPFVHWRKAWVFLVLYGFCFKMLMVGIFGFGSVGGYDSFIRRSVWLLRMLKVKSLEINFLFFPPSKLTIFSLFLPGLRIMEIIEFQNFDFLFYASIFSATKQFIISFSIPFYVNDFALRKEFCVRFYWDRIFIFIIFFNMTVVEQ